MENKLLDSILDTHESSPTTVLLFAGMLCEVVAFITGFFATPFLIFISVAGFLAYLASLVMRDGFMQFQTALITMGVFAVLGSLAALGLAGSSVTGGYEFSFGSLSTLSDAAIVWVILQFVPFFYTGLACSLIILVRKIQA